MMYCVIRVECTIVLQRRLISVGTADGVVGIEVIAELEVGNEGLRAVGKQTALHSLGIMVSQVEHTAEVVVFSNVVVDKVRIKIHLQPVFPVGH